MRDYTTLIKGMLDRPGLTDEEIYMLDGGKAETSDDAFRDLRDITGLRNAPAFFLAELCRLV